MFNYQFFINFLLYLYIIIKIIRIVFFIRLVLEYLPIYNIFKWPLSTIFIMTSPIYKCIIYYIPDIKIGIIQIEIPLLVIFYLFNIILNFLEDLRNEFIELKLLQLIELE